MGLKTQEALKLALEALAASDDFLFNYHDCEPNNEREVDAYSEVRANNMAAWEAVREALAEQQSGIKQVIELYDSPEQPAYRAVKTWHDGKPVYVAEQPAQEQEPFGYFKAEPFGWTDCAETDEGAIALYERPQPAQPSKPWVGLTSEDKVEILRANGEAAVLILTEAKLREKNNG